ncbi:MAG: IS110 family transposase [Planctomycetota bacterium JB042]
MTRITHYVGLDVHKDSIAVAIAAEGRERPRFLGSIPNDGGRLLKLLDKLGSRDTIRCCYEAGPTGYALQRFLRDAQVRCDVVAPTLIPDRKGDRVKTDKRDSIKLARLLRSGDLTSVWVPDEATEALRDLFRARDDAKIAERAARQRLDKFLLRHGRTYPGRTRWTKTHIEWIRKQKFTHEPQQHALCEYLHTVELASDSVARLTDAISKHAVDSSLLPLIESLQALKGVDLLTAVGLSVELGELRRFESAPALMSFIGLGVAESTTGRKSRRFCITKTGNGIVRRLLVESAWAYRHPPRMGPRLKKRSEHLAVEIKRIAWKAQHRLNLRYRRMLARKKPKQVAVVAMARELAGFVWAIGRQVELTPT